MKHKCFYRLDDYLLADLKLLRAFICIHLLGLPLTLLYWIGFISCDCNLKPFSTNSLNSHVCSKPQCFSLPAGLCILPQFSIRLWVRMLRYRLKLWQPRCKKSSWKLCSLAPSLFLIGPRLHRSGFPRSCIMLIYWLSTASDGSHLDSFLLGLTVKNEQITWIFKKGNLILSGPDISGREIMWPTHVVFNFLLRLFVKQLK